MGRPIAPGLVRFDPPLGERDDASGAWLADAAQIRARRDRELLEAASSEAFAELDRSTGIPLTGRLAAALGWTDDDPAGDFTARVHPAHRRRWLDAIAAHRAGPETAALELVVAAAHRHLGWRFFRVRGASRPGPDGRAGRTLLAFTDVTEERAAVERADAAEARLAVLEAELRRRRRAPLASPPHAAVQRLEPGRAAAASASGRAAAASASGRAFAASASGRAAAASASGRAAAASASGRAAAASASGRAAAASAARWAQIERALRQAERSLEAIPRLRPSPTSTTWSRAREALERLAASAAPGPAPVGAAAARVSSLTEELALVGLNTQLEALHLGPAGSGLATVAAQLKGLAQATLRATAELEAALERSDDETERSGRALADLATALDDLEARSEADRAERAELSRMSLEPLWSGIGEARRLAGGLRPPGTSLGRGSPQSGSSSGPLI